MDALERDHLPQAFRVKEITLREGFRAPDQICTSRIGKSCRADKARCHYFTSEIHETQDGQYPTRLPYFIPSSRLPYPNFSIRSTTLTNTRDSIQLRNATRVHYQLVITTTAQDPSTSLSRSDLRDAYHRTLHRVEGSRFFDN